MMSQILRGVAAACLAGLLAMPARAAEDIRLHPIRETVDHPSFRSKLDPAIRFYFRGEQTPVVLEKLGGTSMRLRGNKTDHYPCTRVLVVEVRELQARARKAGGNALVDLVTVARGRDTPNAGQFECEYGGTVVLIEIRGEIVKLADR